MNRPWFAVVGVVVLVAVSACDVARTAHMASSATVGSSSPEVSSLAATTEIAPSFGATTPTPTPTGPGHPLAPAPVPRPANFSVRSVSFTDPRNGWALGEQAPFNESNILELRHTRDGGRTWSALPTPPGGGPPRGPASTAPFPARTLRFANTRTGYLAGPRLYLTRDGGRSWSEQLPDHVIQIEVTDQRVFALSEPSDGVHLVFSAEIGSDRWSTWRVPGTEYAVRLTAARDTALVLAAGNQLVDEEPYHAGELWVSVDHEPAWVLHASPCHRVDSGAQFVTIAFRRPAAWLVDCFSNQQSQGAVHTLHHLYATANAGRHWSRGADPAAYGVPTLLASNGAGRLLFVTAGGAAAGQLRTSADDGLSWRTTLGTNTDYTGWTDLHFVTTATAFVVVPTETSKNVYRTDDGGRHWSALPVR